MRKIFQLLSCMLICMSTQVMANSNCFIVKENTKVIARQGQCEQRHPPCSTFKLAISLMAYNEGILTDETHPLWSHQPSKDDWKPSKPSWYQPHDPLTWIRDSCVWYSQIITTKMGAEKFNNYVHDFHYGNEDVSGDQGKDNGLTRAWLSSSLQISPDEQIEFLQRFLAGKIAVNKKSLTLTHTIFFVKDLPNGWKLYGKTGSGPQQNSDKSLKLNQQVGWFIGWVEKGPRKIVFAKYIESPYQNELTAGQDAKRAIIQYFENHQFE